MPLLFDLDGTRQERRRGSVAVAWGYGSLHELTAAGPDRIVASCGELMDYVRDVGLRRL